MNTSTSPRAAALAAGEKHYVTGKPCKQGHMSPRATHNGTCLQCTAEASKRWLEAHPGKGAAYAAAYRERNQTAVQEKDRALKARTRAEHPQHVRDVNKRSYAKRVMEAHGRAVRTDSRLPLTELVQRLQQAHKGQVLYVGEYQSMASDALFTCAVHGGELYAHPHNVLRGANPCTRCNHTASRGEQEVLALVQNYTPARSRDRKLLRPKELDIYMPEASLAVEYCGMYYHSAGSPEEERAMRMRHAEKHQLCEAQGVRLITLWETEWREHRRAVQRLLRNAAGKSRGKLMARKCTLQKVAPAQARVFYDMYHPQGGAGAGEHYALFWKGAMVACMRFTIGANDRGTGAAKRVWTLTRYATRITVAGGASRLFQAFLQEYQPSEVKSFSDNRLFGGGMYSQLGFVMEEEIRPDYQVWSPRIGLHPKTHYQRRNIPQRLLDHGLDEVFDPETDPRSEADMTYLMGARRIYDCGKKRWVWRPL